MATCGECGLFFKIPESDLDYEKGKGDCVMQKQDQKGKYWVSRPVCESDQACDQKKDRR